MNNYSRANPSGSYLKNIKYYKHMHKHGFQSTFKKKRIMKIQEKVKEEAYEGTSTLPYVEIIKNIITFYQCKSLLDYGCGKAKLYNEAFKTNKGSYTNLKDYWNLDINLYDPCYEKYNTLPKSKVDVSICIDVLEHIPEEDVDWVLRELMSLTKKITFINVACYPALAHLPDGRNAHITLQEPSWWQEKLNQCADEFNNLKILAMCGYRLPSYKLKWVTIDIRDSVKKYMK